MIGGLFSTYFFVLSRRICSHLTDVAVNRRTWHLNQMLNNYLLKAATDFSIDLRAASAFSQPFTFTHLPFSRSL